MSTPTSTHTRRKSDVIFPLDQRINYLPVMRELEEKLFSIDGNELILTLFGVDVLEPDIALGVWDLLHSRPTEKKLVTQAMSSLMESNVLLWLAGDVRLLRPDAWVYFAPPYFSDEAENTKMKRKRGRSIFNSTNIDDWRVQELILHYLPLELGHRRVWLSELSEWIEVSPTRNANHFPFANNFSQIDPQLINPKFPDDEIPF